MKKFVSTVLVVCTMSLLAACGGNNVKSDREKLIDAYIESGFTEEEATELVGEFTDEDVKELLELGNE